MSCIQPQYSLPLVRESVVGNETMIMCAIRLDLCCNFEAVVIFGLTEPFCEYNDQDQTCDRKVLDKDTIVFSTKIPKEAKNKYYPDQYVFCNSMGSYMSTRIIWDTSTDFEDNLSAVAVNTTAIEVSWKPPKHVAPDLVYRLTVGTNVADIKERGFNGLYIMGGLTPDTNYKVSVCLVFRNPDSLAPCITTSVSTRSLADRPVGVWLVALSSTAVLVLWEYPMNRNQKFDDYRLNISDGVGSQLVGVGGRIVVKGLTPSTSYQMTLEAKYAGVDKFGEPVRRSVTTPPTGADLPTNLEAWAVNATAVEVRMDLPNHKVSDGFYMMTVGTQVAKIPAYGFDGVYTMGGLAEETEYVVTVCLEFERPKFSAGCIKTIVTTLPADDRPVGMRLVALSSTVVRVVWEYPRTRIQKFDDYRLNISNGIASRLVGVDGTILVEDLTPSTSYKMTLEAKYAGVDKFGEPVRRSVTTPPTGANLPTNLKAWAVNATAVEVSMDLPKHEVPDAFYMMKVGSQVAKVPAYQFSGLYTMGGLAEDTTYKVTVCLYFERPDFSAGCIETTVTTQPTDDRPVGMRLAALSSTAVLVVWERPMSKNQKFDNYRLNISGGIGSRFVNGGGRIVVKDLTPSTSYNMTLEAKYAGAEKFGEPLRESVTTLPTGDYLPTNLTAWAVNATAVEVGMGLPKYKVPDAFYMITVGTQVAKIPTFLFNGPYAMGGLAEDTTYTVTGCLIFKNPDFSAGCIETTVTTQPTDDRPVGMRLAALSSTVVLVVWEHPKSRNQKFDDYRLNISDGIASQLVNGGGRIVIKDLTPSTSYEMTLEAKYAGTDKFGKPLRKSVTTPPTGAYLPTNITAWAVNATAVEVRMDLSNYKIPDAYYMITVGAHVAEMPAFLFDGIYTIGGLEEGTTDKVTVCLVFKNPDFSVGCIETTVTAQPKP